MERGQNFAADSNALKVLTYDLVEDNAKIRIDGTQEYSDTTYDQRAIGGQIGLFAVTFNFKPLSRQSILMHPKSS